MDELSVKEALEATRSGAIERWHRVYDDEHNPRFEAEFKGCKLVLRCRVGSAEFGNTNDILIVYRDWALTMENEELRKEGFKWEKHYTEIYDGLNQVESAHSTSWSYFYREGSWFVADRFSMNPAEYKDLPLLWHDAGNRADGHLS